MRPLYALLVMLLAALVPAAQAADGPDWVVVQQRLDALAPRFPGSATLQAAQCWLDAARHEALRNDRSAFVEQAVDQADRLVDGLASGRLRAPADAEPRANAQSLRPDLWRAIETLRQGAGAQCIAGRLACAEVSLIHAQHELDQFGWRHANPYIAEAQARIGDALDAAATCR